MPNLAIQATYKGTKKWIRKRNNCVTCQPSNIKTNYKNTQRQKSQLLKPLENLEAYRGTIPDYDSMFDYPVICFVDLGKEDMMFLISLGIVFQVCAPQ